ncbi:arabinan endo-1,5-alpha-L-arabinosidase [Sorangium cellulosum]|uniref:arabinan endo-1,5-alpha-L-arabinosidase n=1 Tax=Sorangium cellulosum TaxID=56 RepID=UPI001F435631|nr:arabinan endo-1,5-alpha-L-arabinosidase [Sorangium cellulosum]
MSARAWGLLSVVASLHCSSESPGPGAGAGGQDSGTAGAATSSTTASATSSSGAGGDAGATAGVGGAGGAGGPAARGRPAARGDRRRWGTGGGEVGDRCAEAILDPASPPEALRLSGNLGTHDPVVIKAGDRYHLFQTGDRLPMKVSSNLIDWQDTGRVFDAKPAWLAGKVPGVDHLWAPDISRFGDTYHLYYSASTFGSNKSCIGHATKVSLDTREPWADRGAAICSNDGTRDDWNAIDPNVAIDEDGTPWLVFGSFWSGIKMVKLTPSGERADAELHALASRPDAAGAIEAPFIVRRCGFYYLFVSFDACCRGTDSTYKIAVGRSPSITGPYVDKEGREMRSGGGTLLVQGDSRWRGPGHNAVMFEGGRAYNLYHAYDVQANGAPTLRISELVWDSDGWPRSGGP